MDLAPFIKTGIMIALKTDFVNELAVERTTSQMADYLQYTSSKRYESHVFKCQSVYCQISLEHTAAIACCSVL